MHGLLICVGIVAMTGAAGVLKLRRRRRRIEQTIAARGGRVVFVKWGSRGGSLREVVRYLGPQGELREALVAANAATLTQDRPFQDVLREKYERYESDMLAKLMLASECARLPGAEVFKAIVRELAADPNESMSVQESPADAAKQPNFAPLLQRVEAASITSKSDNILELVADGKTLDVRWSLQGEAPHRTLTLTALAPDLSSARGVAGPPNQ